MIDIIIPAAGDGTRFRTAGYMQPKPLIDVMGQPMLRRVIANLKPRLEHRFIIISRLDPAIMRPLLDQDRDIPLQLDRPTEGAVDTILKARDHITEDPILIGYCDQLVHFDVTELIEQATAVGGVDGVVATFRSHMPHHSYVHLNPRQSDGLATITKIVEKQVISNRAVAGVYYFRRGDAFLDAADAVMATNERIRGEFYVSSVISRMIKSGLRVITHDAPSTMLGTPEELRAFETAESASGQLLSA